MGPSSSISKSIRLPQLELLAAEERRRDLRLECQLPVRVHLGSKTFAAQLTDLSWAGFCLTSGSCVPRGSLVHISLVLNSEKMSCWSVCRWSRKLGDGESLSGHEFLNGSGAPVKPWIHRCLRELGKNESHLKERRRESRLLVEVAARLLDGRDIRGRLTDVSRKGGRLVLGQPIFYPFLHLQLMFHDHQLNLKARRCATRLTQEQSFSHHLCWVPGEEDSRALANWLSEGVLVPGRSS